MEKSYREIKLRKAFISTLEVTEINREPAAERSHFRIRDIGLGVDFIYLIHDSRYMSERERERERHEK